MIKAENITHEGTPAANWLDKCRSAVNPLSIAALVIIIGLVITLVIINHHTSNPVKASTQPKATQSSQLLQVTPLTGAGQAAGATADSATQANTTVGSTSVSAIPTSDGAPTAADPAPVANSQLQSAISSLSQQAQTTTQGAQNNLNSLVDGTLKGL